MTITDASPQTTTRVADAMLAGDAHAAVRMARVVLCLTDDGQEPAFGYARRAAARIAAAVDARLVLSDRSRESWAMTPFVFAPAAPTELIRRGDDYLLSQIHEAHALGVTDVLVVAPTTPGLDAVTDAVETARADLVVIPERYQRPRLVERVVLATTTLEHAVAERVKARVLVAHPDGHLTLGRPARTPARTPVRSSGPTGMAPETLAKRQRWLSRSWLPRLAQALDRGATRRGSRPLAPGPAADRNGSDPDQATTPAGPRRPQTRATHSPRSPPRRGEGGPGRGPRRSRGRPGAARAASPRRTARPSSTPAL